MDNFFSTVHPYGVLPAGNAYFAEAGLLMVRVEGFGVAHVLKDEAIVETLSFLNGRELTQLSSTSRVVYVFCHFSDLWRDLTLRLDNSNVQFSSSWKQTYVQHHARMLNKCGDFFLHKPISVRGIYSNLLHRSWACVSCDLESACPGFYNDCGIQRKDARELTIDDFISQFERPNIPVVISNCVDHWPALSKWNMDHLATCCGQRLFRATSATAPTAASFTIKEYASYINSTKEESPLYLFERDFGRSTDLEGDYDIPKYFASTSSHGSDLFRVFGPTRRPDHRWLIAGPARSGSIFHIDPNQTNAWNVAVVGRKKWIFYPPGVSPPGVVSSEDGADVTVPLSTGEWLLAFWKHHQAAKRTWAEHQRPLEVTLHPGEVIFVPHGYWHMVVNLDDCIALTHNYVSESNLADCLRFLREKPDQISGVRDRPGEAVQAEGLYEEFLQQLEPVLGAERVRVAVEASLAPDDNANQRTGRGRREGVMRSGPRKRARKAAVGAARAFLSLDEVADSAVTLPTFTFAFDLS